MTHIRNRAFKQQIVSFDGLEYADGILPTDIDCKIDFGGRLAVTVEVKYASKAIDRGQLRALRTWSDAEHRGSLDSLLIIGRHWHPVGEDIVIAAAEVVDARFNGAWLHRFDIERHTVRTLIDEKLTELGLAERYILPRIERAA